jgi:hypothetical protein
MTARLKPYHPIPIENSTLIQAIYGNFSTSVDPLENPFLTKVFGRFCNLIDKKIAETHSRLNLSDEIMN